MRESRTRPIADRRARLRLAIARLSGWPRRTLALLLLLLAVVLAQRPADGTPTASPPTETRLVLAPTRDLPPGHRLSAADLQEVRLPVNVVPSGALTPDQRVAGRTLAAPVRRGEPLTDLRLASPALTSALATSLAGPDAVAVPVRMTDAEAAALLRQGDRVDVLATTEGAPARLVAGDIHVLSAPRQPADASLADGAIVVFAATPETARQLAGISPTARVTVTLRPP